MTPVVDATGAGINAVAFKRVVSPRIQFLSQKRRRSNENDVPRFAILPCQEWIHSGVFTRPDRNAAPTGPCQKRTNKPTGWIVQFCAGLFGDRENGAGE